MNLHQGSIIRGFSDFVAWVCADQKHTSGSICGESLDYICLFVCFRVSSTSTSLRRVLAGLVGNKQWLLIQKRVIWRPDASEIFNTNLHQHECESRASKFPASERTHLSKIFSDHRTRNFRCCLWNHSMRAGTLRNRVRQAHAWSVIGYLHLTSWTWQPWW